MPLLGNKSKAATVVPQEPSQRPPRSNKERLVRASAEAEESQRLLERVDSELPATLQRVTTDRQLQAESAEQLQATQQQTASVREEGEALTAKLAEARATKSQLAADIHAADAVATVERQAAGELRQELQRLAVLRAALGAARRDDATTKLSDPMMLALQREATIEAAKPLEALTLQVKAAVSEVATITSEGVAWREEHASILESIRKLRLEHEEARETLKESQQAVTRAQVENGDLQQKVQQTKEALEEIRQSYQNLEGTHVRMGKDIEQYQSTLDALGLTYCGEVDHTIPVMVQTRERKLEAKSTHEHRFREIAAASEARVRRMSRDATLNDSSKPAPVQAACRAPMLPGPMYAVQDVCPTRAKVKELRKVDAYSTGIPLPGQLKDLELSGLSRTGRFVVGTDGVRT